MFVKNILNVKVIFSSYFYIYIFTCERIALLCSATLMKYISIFHLLFLVWCAHCDIYLGGYFWYAVLIRICDTEKEIDFERWWKLWLVVTINKIFIDSANCCCHWSDSEFVCLFILFIYLLLSPARNSSFLDKGYFLSVLNDQRLSFF